MSRSDRNAEREWIDYMSERNDRAARIRRLRRSTEKRESVFIRAALAISKNPDAPVVIAAVLGWIAIAAILITENL